eukprot:1499136-Rhodomonas_salina.2
MRATATAPPIKHQRPKQKHPSWTSSPSGDVDLRGGTPDRRSARTAQFDGFIDSFPPKLEWWHR